MVDIKEYNKRELKSLEAYLMLKREEKDFWDGNKGSSWNSNASKAYGSLIDRMHSLNPLAGKEETGEHPGSKYDLDSGYVRKLPLDSLDGKIITVVEECLKEDWVFLQSRIWKSGYRSEHVMIFRYTKEVDYAEMKKNLKKRQLGEHPHFIFEYNHEFISLVGLDNAGERLAEILSDRYKLTGIKLTADVDWPGQGEGPCINYEYLCVVLYMDDISLVRKQFRDKVKEAEKKLTEAKNNLRMYSE